MPETLYRSRLIAALAIVILPLAAAAQGDAGPPRIGRGQPLTLSVRDAIERALKSNLDIRLERYTLDVNRIRLVGAAGFYDPAVTLSSTANSSTTPATSLLQGSSITSETSASRSFSTGIQQNLWSGGSLSVTASEARSSTNNSFSFVNPIFGSGLDVRFSQPLLKNFVRNPTRRTLRILNLNTRIGEAQFRQAVAALVQRVVEQYWNFAFALESLQARQESRELAVNQRNQIQQKVQAGLLTPIALASANAEVAFREQEIIQSEAQIVAAENGLKALLADDPTADIWRRTLIPSGSPDPGHPPASLDDAIAEALRNRPELEALDLQTRQNQIDRDFLKWDSRPQVNLVAGFGSIGRAGQVYRTLYDTNNSFVPVGREPDPTHPGFGGISKSLGQAFAFDYPNWTLGVNVQVPILNRSAKAQIAEADVARARLDTSVKRQQQAIMVEVANAFEIVALNRKALEVARVARELSQEQVRGETARFEAGFTTNFEVLRYQRDLADARLRELRAKVDYEIAVAALQKATAQIVSANDLVIARAGH
jgi:HAE1 family hydrophobic/amphiphilic exporter-1